MAEHNETGKKGENMALEFLQKKGYRILEQNWQLGRNEIDIVARDGDTIVIVEVKTRSSNWAGEPEAFVDRKKQRLLVRAANAYVLRKNIQEEVRFDIIAILTGEENARINHIPDAFYPTL